MASREHRGTDRQHQMSMRSVNMSLKCKCLPGLCGPKMPKVAKENPIRIIPTLSLPAAGECRGWGERQVGKTVYK